MKAVHMRAHALLPAAAAWLLLALPALAQPVTTPQQASRAQQVAQAGVPLADLAPNAPDRYTVKSGDTLWGISTMYLKTPWRWPDLWGMNMTEIRNPHRIFPGQVLVLEKSDGKARLRVGDGPATAAADDALPTVKVSPRTRVEGMRDAAIPTIAVRDIEAFLAQPMLVSATELDRAPRIVAAQEGRVILSKGDRAYVRSSDGKPLGAQTLEAEQWRIVRNAVALRDPISKAILGYEAEFVGRADMIRGESTRQVADGSKTATQAIPATVIITRSSQEAYTGDRLIAEPAREFMEFTPRAPQFATDARVVAVYGSNAQMASQNQVIVLNRGAAHGLERGHVLAALTEGIVQRDATQPARTADTLKLPDERNGLVMIYKTYDQVSYALVLSLDDGLRIGDRLVNPR
jgi:hypothetical protein